MALWTARSTKVTKNPDGLTLTLEYELTDGIEVVQKSDSRATPHSIINILQNAVNDLNRVEAEKQSIADLEPSTMVGTLEELRAAKIIPPTQEGLDLQAFRVARQDYIAKKKAVDEGLSKTLTQTDVDDAYAAMKTLYKEEYGAFL